MAKWNERPTTQMVPLDLARLVDEAGGDLHRPTCKMEKLQLVELLWPEGSSPSLDVAARTSPNVLPSRAVAPCCVANELDPDAMQTAPVLYVITTPPEVRARWETWKWIRRELALCLAIVAVLIAFMFTSG